MIPPEVNISACQGRHSVWHIVLDNHPAAAAAAAEISL